MRSPSRVLSNPVDPPNDGVRVIDGGRGMASPLHLSGLGGLPGSSPVAAMSLGFGSRTHT